MRLSRVAGILLLAGMASGANAQIVAAPPTATVVNFDDFPLPGEFTIPLPVVTTEYTDSRGVTFQGFGTNAGGLVNPDFGTPPPPWFSPPNIMYFVSIFPVSSGGLAQSPETLSFYPPITSFQFDASTLGVDCEGRSIVTVSGFDTNGNALGSISAAATTDGVTIALAFPAPGAEKVVVTSTHTCGPVGSLFDGVEVFSMDNVAFTHVGAGASKCAQSALDAAGKKAKAVATCNAKALQNGVPVDQACLDKATANFDKGFTKAQAAGDCQTDADGPTIEGAVDAFVANAVQLVAGTSPGPDVCFGKKLTAIGKKAQSLIKCYSKASQKGTTVDAACGQKAANSFNASLKKCGTPTQLSSVEGLVDALGASLSRTLTVPTTTTTTTTTSTTTTTTAPPLGQHLSFTTTPGTAQCGSAKFTTPADPPFSGEIDSDMVGTKLFDLGAGCLNIGGGNASIPPSQIPENATTILDSPDGTNLVASFGTGRADCSRGPEATKHCVNDPTIACSTDAECAGVASACAADANCFFGPPVEVNGFPPTCVVNTFAQDASGTVNTATGESSVSINLASRVFLTLGQPSTCPHCDGGTCNWGPNQGQACTTTNSQLTTLDCPPTPGIFLATLPVDLTPLTSGTNTVTAPDGLFCTGQLHPGAFGVAPQNTDPDPPPPFAQVITHTGSPGGDLTDGLPHPSVLVSNFCIPKTGGAAVDNTADLPGPGSLSLLGNAQFFASPSGAFLTD